MDYPKSVPSVGLVDGRFVDENPVAGTPGSLIPAVWGNSVTQEILSVINGGGLVASEADTGQLYKAIQSIIGRASPMRSVITRLAASKTLTEAELGLVLIDGSPGPVTLLLPPANAALGVRDVIVRRVDNSGNRMVIQASGTDWIRFHTHLSASGYPFFVLMGGGDWWHLRSDGAGSWWPVGRFDNTPLGRPFFETTLMLSPGGYGALNGTVMKRAEWPWLWDHAQQSGMLGTEALRVGSEGKWTTGDGATTFRGPEGRGEFLRVLDEDRGVDAGRAMGTFQTGSTHSYAQGANGAGAVGAYWSDSLTSFGADTREEPQYVTGLINGGPTFPVNTTYQRDTAATLLYAFKSRPRNIAYPGRIKLI
ncbi:MULTISPECIES: phage tail protein [unclassified Pseudomonas]|uniref:phage tail protein n=1 Tax=unclassified Pseudomonas TaxID=196821 RepID=UPI000CCFF3C0|nr:MULTISPECIES: phage tail protein [unclassified Pseudomonas]POA25514.1 phage tail protein [Pseudomonas sp. FW305-3-2-15-E-TSA4]POA41111.1 phage tail protein [Pseudomonas sp. FW305-3-2-15-E-TSA2]